MSVQSWDLDAGNSGGGKIGFIKFPEGITRIRIIDNAPYQRWIHFFRKFKRSVNCPGKSCPICEIRRAEKANKMPYSYDMQKKFVLNVINRETGNVEIMEQGKTFMQDLIDLKGDLERKGKTIQDADFKIRRRGTTKDDTSYRIDIDEESPLSVKDMELAKSKLNFAEYFKPTPVEKILRLINGEDWEIVMKNDDESNDTVSIDEDGHVNIPEDESIELA
jgi:hypothetical protein